MICRQDAMGINGLPYFLALQTNVFEYSVPTPLNTAVIWPCIHDRYLNRPILALSSAKSISSSSLNVCLSNVTDTLTL